MRNWLEITVGIYLLGMILYGHYRGFVRQALSIVSLIATFGIVNAAMPQMCTFLKEHTPIVSLIEETVTEKISVEDMLFPEQQTQMMESLELPDTLKQFLIENNNGQIYEALGVTKFQEYIGNCIANAMVSVVSYVILLFLVYLMIRMAANWLNLVTKLPILSGINKIAGAVLGGIQGLFFFWIAASLLTVAGNTAWGSEVLNQIEASHWLSLLYHLNPVTKFVFGIAQGMLKKS